MAAPSRKGLNLGSHEIRGSRTVGVISDTHGVLLPEAVKLLTGADLIIHAGDIHTGAVLNELKRIAPVAAVLGNMDRGEWASALFETEIIEIGPCLLYVLHDINRLDLDPAAAGIHAVIHGHLHQPSDVMQNGIRFLNPGSPTQPRRNSPPSLLKLHISGTEIRPKFFRLDTESPFTLSS